MQQPQPCKNKRKCVPDLDEHRKRALKSIIVKDLPIHDIRWNLGYLTQLHEPVLCKGAPVNGSSADAINKVIFRVLMSYSDAFQLESTSHPLENVILKPGNYLEGPKPGILKKMNDTSLPPNDYGMYEVHIPENKTLEDINTLKMINWLWVNKRHNYDAWMKMISVMVLTQHEIRVGQIENDFKKKCISTRVSVNALIGDRGLCHGLCDLIVPKLEIDRCTGLYNWPGWALTFDTDDNSSFHSSSPDNSDFDTDSVDSGPMGVACNRPRITGLTSFTETSSESSSEISSKTKTSRLDFFIHGHRGDYWDRRMRKRFDLYMRTSFNERRNRGAIRHARRKVRRQYDTDRRMMEPLFDAEAKRAEALAAERVRAEVRHQKAKQRVNINPTPRGKSIEHYLYRYKQYCHKLRSQLECSWTRYYGKKSIPKHLNNSAHRNDISLKCWVSPVPWIHQTGINGGFSAISMALRQLRFIDVIMREMEGTNSDELKDMLRLLSPNAAAYLNSLQTRFDTFGVNSLSELNHSTMMHLISIMREGKVSNWGEIFSGDVLAHVAIIANVFNTRFQIRYVRQDILANHTNYGSPEETVSLSIVQRLVRGHLIAVCFDADEKKRPTTNGGRSAYWTLLCGVIVGFPLKKPTKEPLLVKNFERKDTQLAYTYHYEPETHLLTPVGFVCPETDEPVDIETLKNRAEHDKTNHNSDMQSKSCKIGPRMCHNCMIEYVDKQLDLKRDADSVWVVARHRDEYLVWTLGELAKSNRQLRTPGKDILKTVPQQRKNEWMIRDFLIGRRRPSPGESLKLINSAYRQKERERLNTERRKNRDVCTMVVEQMESLGRENPYLPPSELVEFLDLSMYPRHLAEVWKSAAKVAYETPVKFPRTEPIPPAMPMTEESTHQMPVAPPPYPIPTSPTPVSPPTNTGSPSTNCPYLLHSGPNFDYCLAQQYVCFEPIEKQYQNYGMDCVPDMKNINDILVMPVQFHFEIEGKMTSSIRKKQRSRRAAAKNRDSTSDTFTG